MNQPTPRQLKILVADDDADLRALLNFTLYQAGFAVQLAQDGEHALQAFKEHAPDLLLLDVNMPKRDGLEVCREIRKESAVPIMMLTVRDQEDDLVAALNCGADDFVSKPFSPRALLARIRSLARRADPLNSTDLVGGKAHLDVARRSFRIGDAAPLRLSVMETKVVSQLLASPGRTVTAERLLLHLWGNSGGRERHTLKQLIYRLRKKLERDPADPQVLQTTPGSGYKLMVE